MGARRACRRRAGSAARRQAVSARRGSSSTGGSPCRRPRPPGAAVIYWTACCIGPPASPGACRVSSGVPGKTDNELLIISNEKKMILYSGLIIETVRTSLSVDSDLWPNLYGN